MKKMNIDEFVSLKRNHGRLVAYTKAEVTSIVYEWKKEFGWPEHYHMLRFADGREWDVINGLRPESK